MNQAQFLKPPNNHDLKRKKQAIMERLAAGCLEPSLTLARNKTSDISFILQKRFWRAPRLRGPQGNLLARLWPPPETSLPYLEKKGSRPKDKGGLLRPGKFSPSLSAIIVLILFLIFTLNSSPVFLEASPQPLSPSHPDYPGIIAAYEAFVSQQMKRDSVPGMSVAFQHGDFFWAQGFGWADVENEVPAKPESAYRLASITKTITALAILLLYEEGKIDLDAEVQNYVPSFPRKPWPITIRQLLGHLGGLSHYRNYELEGHIREPKTTEEALAIFKDFALIAEPGTKYNYSTYGFNLLGAVVEATSGMSYGDFIRERIFLPLGLTASRLDSPADLIPNRVRGYRLVGGDVKPSEFIDVSSRFAGGGVRSTVVDLVRYAYGLIVEGKLLRPEIRRLMLTSQTQRNGFFTNYGLGWVVNPWNGHVHVSHGGSQPETRTHLAVFPEEKLVIAVACNLEGTNLIPYVRKLAELIFAETIDLDAYTTDIDSSIIWRACEQAFNYGLSQFYWNKGPLTSTPSEIKNSFDAFNRYLNPKGLFKNRLAGRNFVLTGVHPAGRQVLTKVGSFLASVLAQGEPASLKKYHQKGVVSFFRDYIDLSEKKPGQQSLPRFDREFVQLIQTWERDWPKTFTPEWTSLSLVDSTDWVEISQRLRRAFAGTVIFPNYSDDYIRAAQEALNKQNPDQAFRLIRLGLEVYPLSPALQAALAITCFWVGETAVGQKALKEAFFLDPHHPSISADRFLTWSGQLERAKKLKEALLLIETGLIYYPREARLYYEAGRLNWQANNQDKALLALEKALSIDPQLEEAKLLWEKIKRK